LYLSLLFFIGVSAAALLFLARNNCGLPLKRQRFESALAVPFYGFPKTIARLRGPFDVASALAAVELPTNSSEPPMSLGTFSLAWHLSLSYIAVGWVGVTHYHDIFRINLKKGVRTFLPYQWSKTN
jgi:hypothetical protein